LSTGKISFLRKICEKANVILELERAPLGLVAHCVQIQTGSKEGDEKSWENVS
jgi:hypothetical protein